ncbi:CRISPR-associated endonuclease Cas1 [Anoxybacillus thermarum]|uniref:CRISPR-associated endonuclease Cas1 n=1 Tax=Anoxybacillus thermarum TaxID=404937 RepID=A0A0D0S0R6_9BACL|nr:CRISPR-associated endonuclease Cas1 [Anoxybacillus thermarum]KIQ94501.1 CRISPR-associated endonuclease Cas1 [Anoxybacillus thermarum]
MSTLYVMEQGALLKKSGERLIVSLNKKTVVEKHFRDISRVLLFGNIQMTTQVVHQFLMSGIDVCYFTMNGIYRGKLQSTTSQNLYTKMAQMTHWSNKQFLLELSKQIVVLKIDGQRHVLQQRRRGVPSSSEKFSESISQLDKAINDAKEAGSVSVLRGIEGNAARVYFSCWDHLLPSDFPFERRSRRPALNGMNSALNFSYTLLLNETHSVLESYGFDVMLGVYHSIRYGRVSLALDTMEMFRPIFVDRWLIMLARRKQIQAKDFYLDSHAGVYFTKEGRQKFLHLYQQWQEKCALRKQIETVVDGLEKSMLEGDENAFRQATEKVLYRLL